MNTAAVEDAVEARQVPFLADAEEEDLVEVVDGRLRRHLPDDARGGGPQELGAFPLVETSHPSQGLGPLC